MAYKSYFINARGGPGGSGDEILERDTRTREDVADISTQLDSVRAYQWEVTLNFPGMGERMSKLGGTNDGATIDKPLTLAAKQVNGLGMSVEDIEVNRVNDKVYYPGRPSMEEAVITFDNLQRNKIDRLLYELFASTYDPRTGGFNNTAANLKGDINLVQLQADGSPRNSIYLQGAYPKNLTHGEYNYSTNEFHTIEMTFRYDFLINVNDADGLVTGTIQ